MENAEQLSSWLLDTLSAPARFQPPRPSSCLGGQATAWRSGAPKANEEAHHPTVFRVLLGRGDSVLWAAVPLPDSVEEPSNPAEQVPPQLPLLDGPPLPAPPLWPRALSWKSNRRKLYSALQATQPAATLWVPLQETQEPQLLNNDGSVQPGHSILYYQTFSTMDLLNWRHQTLLYSEKPQAMIDLLESIFQTHQPTWDDIQQLLLTLFNTKERKQIITETKKWLQEQAPEGTMYAEEWAQNAAPDTRPE
ncbi:uncharacterized protein LOC116664450 [Camelus ferus]|uniref:Uncharacterized protein LOC116664450 n=1 Tax=Camelus ferus TaxID=419612 RepID=A0A8B8T9A4_CAMFR|nr:uncharacterized protein LOC116664450 [Camelus ferus]